MICSDAARTRRGADATPRRRGRDGRRRAKRVLPPHGAALEACERLGPQRRVQGGEGLRAGRRALHCRSCKSRSGDSRERRSGAAQARPARNASAQDVLRQHSLKPRQAEGTAQQAVRAMPTGYKVGAAVDYNVNGKWYARPEYESKRARSPPARRGIRDADVRPQVPRQRSSAATTRCRRHDASRAVSCVCAKIVRTQATSREKTATTSSLNTTRRSSRATRSRSPSAPRRTRRG